MSDMGIGDLLNQEQVWQARNGDGALDVVPLDEMSVSHLINLLNWLERKAESLQSAEITALYNVSSMIRGEQALIDLDTDIGRAEGQPAMEWLESKPLYEALTRRLERLTSSGD